MDMDKSSMGCNRVEVVTSVLRRRRWNQNKSLKSTTTPLNPEVLRSRLPGHSTAQAHSALSNLPPLLFREK